MMLLSNLFLHQHKNIHGTEYHKCRSCNTSLIGNNPASIYQIQKLIQNTVRVKSSLYAMNLAALSTYQPPPKTPQLINGEYVVPAHVYWNQMSDRARPSRQIVRNTNNASSTRHTITRHRPGALSPGGDGVDIKHNYYGRYLNKLKQGPIRRGPVPPDFGGYIPFNRAYPVYGGKVTKTAIINCKCDNDKTSLKPIYENELNSLEERILSVRYEFHVGDHVYAHKNEDDKAYYEAVIINIENGIYTVQFVDDNTIRNDLTYSDLMGYFNCDCSQDILDI